MRHLFSDQISDFASIYDEDVELISVACSGPNHARLVGEKLFDPGQRPQLRWMQAAGDADASDAVLPATLDSEVRDLLLAQISEASEVMAELIDCAQIGVRLQTLNSPMCPRFHVDNVPCRMLITLSGAGTQWICNDDVDPHILADLDTVAPPLKNDGEIQSLATGHWSLLKGGAWSEDFAGVVHRSPDGVGDRLLLSLDPVFQ